MNSCTLSRTPPTLDDALYSASCFAGNAEDRVCTILWSVQVTGTRTTLHTPCPGMSREFYRVEDGRSAAYRDNVTGLDWRPAYYIEATNR